MQGTKVNVKLLYLFGVPMVFAFLFEFIFKVINIARFYNFLENILFAIVLILLGLLIKSNRKKHYFLIVGLLIYNFCLLFETIYYYLFDSTLNSSAVFVVLETNLEEMKEFLSFHFDRNVLFLILTICLITVIGIKNLKKILKENLFEIEERFTLVEFLIVIYFFLKFTKLIIFNVPYLLVKTPILYIQEMNKFNAYGVGNKQGNFTNVKRNDLPVNEELYIIVIGESTNRKHFNLNHNYYRETTPQLNSIRDDLYVFNDVISPHTYTIGSLTKVLTLGNYENKNKIFDGSIVQLFNQANFKTYWISNQRPLGMMDTHVTKIGLGASKSIFLNTNHAKEKTTYDDVLINSLSEVLKEEGNKKAIFLNMLGAHLNYKNRYPKSEEYFKDKPNTNFNSDKAFDVINAYDNAIRYSDKILKEIIAIAEKQNVVSYVLFFSDHGQEVFDEIDFSGHTIDEQITRNMYEIPMFLWLSNKYKAVNPRNFNLDTKYMIDDLFHSIADISNIKSSETDSTRSIFSESFKERTRIIKDTINYDLFFEK